MKPGPSDIRFLKIIPSFRRASKSTALLAVLLNAATGCAPASPEELLTGAPWRVQSARLTALPAGSDLARNAEQANWQGRRYEFSPDGAYAATVGGETRKGRWELRDSTLQLFYHEQAAHEWRLLALTPDSILARQSKGLALRIVLVPQK